ncbi:hypothetical protein [Streptomyces sp. Isolate_45]|uniref:hypothetical protein n=1 Tax=Streptomyces sp. Isolate_45 TaxID=2950111 RepID=UPI0032B2A716
MHGRRGAQRTVLNGTACYPDGSLTRKNCADPIPDPKPRPPKPPVGPGTGMIDLSSADLSGDGVVDVVGVEASTGKLFLYPGTGTGLGARTEIGSGGW